MKQKRIIVTMPERQMRMLAEAKQETGASMSEIVRRAVDLYVQELRQRNKQPTTLPPQESRMPAAE